MSLFKADKDILTPIKELSIDLEKDIQTLTEHNLDKIFGLRFISSEFRIQNFRIDTLAYDEETQTLVIIEYKRDKSFSVVDQGVAYLSLLHNNRDSFLLEFARKTNKNVNDIKIDWDQARVIFIANSFTPYQQNAINFKNLPIDLYAVQKFQSGLVSFTQVKSPIEPTASLTSLSRDKKVQEVATQYKTYSVDDHFKDGWDDVRELFEELRERILKIDSRITESATKFYIGYKIGTSRIVYIQVFKSKLLIGLLRTSPEDLDDPEKKVKLQKDSKKFFGQNISEYNVVKESDIDYGIFLIKQVFTMYK